MTFEDTVTGMNETLLTAIAPDNITEYDSSVRVGSNYTRTLLIVDYDLGGEEKSKNLTSRSKDSLPQEVKDFNTNDTELNDTDFSDTEYKINQLRDTQILPEAILDTLMKNKKRLMDDAIDIKDIVNHYLAHQDILSVHQYADALQYSLERTPGKIHSITARLTKAVEDKRRWLVNQSKELVPQGRIEVIPEWMNETNDSSTNIDVISEEEIEQERQRLYESLGRVRS